MNELTKFWQGLPNGKPYVHKADFPLLKKTHIFKSYNEYIEAYSKSETGSVNFHLGLTPIPYIGDILSAKVFVLMLNPGFGHDDYICEEYFPSYRNALWENVMQEKMDYPFLFLNPEFLWTGGGKYWESRFREHAEEISLRQKITYGEALRQIAGKVASLELIPYHSKSQGAGKSIIDGLKSVNAMRGFLRSYVLPKAKNGEVGLIVARGYRHWAQGCDIEESENIVVYSAGEARGASIAPQTRGGAIIKKYLLGHSNRIV